MTSEYTKPLPVAANPDHTQPFWDATKSHKLVLPRCNACSHLFFYPRERCPNCLSGDLSWVESEGKGRVYSFTIIQQPVDKAFLEDIPYIYAIIQLDEGPRMISNVIDCAIEDVCVDMAVTVAFDDVTSDVTLVKFRPA
jgi:uncharacterized OB-fold protein